MASLSIVTVQCFGIVANVIAVVVIMSREIWIYLNSNHSSAARTSINCSGTMRTASWCWWQSNDSNNKEVSIMSTVMHYDGNSIVVASKLLVDGIRRKSNDQPVVKAKCSRAIREMKQCNCSAVVALLLQQFWHAASKSVRRITVM